MSDLVRNSEDPFSHEAHSIMALTGWKPRRQVFSLQDSNWPKPLQIMQILSYRRQFYYLLLVFNAPYTISCTKTGNKRHKNIINTLKYRHLTAIFSILNITSLIHNNYFMSYLMRKSDFWFTERFRPSR